MKILTVSSLLPPDGGAGPLRAAKLMKYLAREGHTISAVAPRSPMGWHRDNTLTTDLQGIHVHRLGGLPSVMSGLRRSRKDPTQSETPGRPRWSRLAWAMRLARDQFAIPDEHLVWFAWVAQRVAVQLEEAPDTWLWTTSFPYSAHLLGSWLKRTTGCRWWADLRDPWAGHTFRGSRHRWRRPVDTMLERWSLDRADRISAVTPTMVQTLRKRYPEKQVAWIANGFDPDDYVKEIAPQPRPELTYVGTFDHSNSPIAPVLEGMRRASRYPALRVVGAFDSISSDQVREASTWLGSHLRVEPFTNHTAAVDIMRQSNVLLLSIAPDRPWIFTSKVFEYLASERPLLAVVPPGDCAQLLRAYPRATVVSPDEPDKLAHVLERIADDTTPTPPSDGASLEKLSWPTRARQVLEFLNGV